MSTRTCMVPTAYFHQTNNWQCVVNQNVFVENRRYHLLTVSGAGTRGRGDAEKGFVTSGWDIQRLLSRSSHGVLSEAWNLFTLIRKFKCSNVSV